VLVGHQLSVAAPEKLVALWQACPFVNHVIALDKPKNIRAVAAKLHDGQFASAVLLPNSLRAALEAWQARIPNRFGYARGARGFLLTRTIPAPPRNPVRLHQKFYYLDLAAALGAPADPSLPELRLPPAADGASPETPDAQAPIAALCPGAEYGPAKRWPIENFAVVGQALADRGFQLVILGAPNDAALATQLVEYLPGARNLTGTTTLEQFMRELSRCRLIVSNDSGAMHLASALGVRTVAIFGSTEPALTGPLGPRSTVLRHHVPCSPCFLRECPIDFACMTQIKPAMVLAAADKLLA
jgi:heptosyltransferase-2